MQAAGDSSRPAACFEYARCFLQLRPSGKVLADGFRPNGLLLKSLMPVHAPRLFRLGFVPYGMAFNRLGPVLPDRLKGINQQVA